MGTIVDTSKVFLFSFKMKVELCSFSGFKIYPGHGIRVLKQDGRAYVFINGKCEKAHAMKRNPRKVNWTFSTGASTRKAYKKRRARNVLGVHKNSSAQSLG